MREGGGELNALVATERYNAELIAVRRLRINLRARVAGQGQARQPRHLEELEKRVNRKSKRLNRLEGQRKHKSFAICCEGLQSDEHSDIL